MNPKIWSRPTTFLLLLLLASCGGAPEAPRVEPNSVLVDQTELVPLRPTFVGMATSFDQRGDDRYSVGYRVDDGKLIAEQSLLASEDRVLSALDLDLVSQGEGFSALLASGDDSSVRVTGSIQSSDDGDGTGSSDFSGLGAAIIATDAADVSLESMNIETKGVLRAAFIADDRANVVVRDSTITTLGANSLTDLPEDYQNGANMTMMLSPPWVLGIQGAVRSGNMLGEEATMSVIGSSVTSGGWAVLSTDACTDPMMNVVDSTLAILPESSGGMTSGPFTYSGNYGTGYGTYLIGNAEQNFYGTHFKGMTFASIFTGGTARYKSSSGALELAKAGGGTVEVVNGQGKPTVIDSVFGFMTHGGATIHVLDGTQVNTEEAAFLYKSGKVDIVVDRAELNSVSGVILQMIDNDDRTVGGNPMAFNTEFNEDEGWPSENGNVTPDGVAVGGGMPPGGPPPGGPDGAAGAPPGPGGPMGPMPEPGVSITFSNGTYTGDVFNGTGYYGQGAVPLDVRIATGANLNGRVSLTETRHVDENGAQNTHFTIDEYYYLGHVENRNFRNGFSEVNVVLDDGGVWTVSGDSFLSSLEIVDGHIAGANDAGVIVTVNGVETEIEAGRRYVGNIVVSTR